MEMQMWTLIGLLAASLLTLITIMAAGIFSVRSEQQRIGSDIRGGNLKVADLTVEVGVIESSLEEHDRRFDAIDSRFDSLEEQIRAQGRELGEAIYGLAEQFREHLRRHAS